MIGYILPDVGPQGAAADKRMERLGSAGPWQYQMHARGAMAVWRVGPPVPRSAFGVERPTTDGMIYLPPKGLPAPKDLLRPRFVQRPDLINVVVSQDTGLTIQLLPAIMTPRQVLDDNSTGGYVTTYGRAVRDLMAKLQSVPEDHPFSEFQSEYAECCRLAVMYTYRLTRELLHDLQWITEESLLGIWEAAINYPKATPSDVAKASA